MIDKECQNCIHCEIWREYGSDLWDCKHKEVDTNLYCAYRDDNKNYALICPFYEERDWEAYHKEGN